MARKHIPLTIARPGVEELQAYTFEALAAAADVYSIPFRYPFADIANLAALQSAGFFRHGLQQPSGGAASVAVSAELGGSASADAITTLGYHLPPTEKLILLVKVNTALTTNTDKVSLTISGSAKYNQPAVVVDSPVNPAAGSVFELDLYNFGLYIGDEGELQIELGAFTTVADFDHIELALVARAF